MVLLPNGNVLVCDSSSGTQLKIWNSIPAAGANNVAPNSTISLTNPLTFVQPGPMAFQALPNNRIRLFISQPSFHRVLFWNNVPTAGQPPDGIFGQPNFKTFTANTGGVSDRSLSLLLAGFLGNGSNAGVAVAGNDLWISDTSNNRILRVPLPPP